MKYIRAYETLHKKNIIEGNIYVIDSKLILTPTINGQNIPLGRIIAYARDYVTIKTFIKGNLEEYEFLGAHKSILKRKATKEEIIEFESIENRNKYNI